MMQQTLASVCTLSGIGIHSGQPCTITLHPQMENTGIRLSRTDHPDLVLNAHPSAILGTNRATILGNSYTKICTPEHLLSACVGLHLHNVWIEVSSEEIPILDGSASCFCDAILKTGLIQQKNTSIQKLKILEPIHIKQNMARLLILPSPETRYTYVLDYPQSHIGCQTASYSLEQNSYHTDIAPARTYGFYDELHTLLEKGLAQGGSLDCALVIGETGYINVPRFENEMARHKVLDLMGDFALVGHLLEGHIIGIQSGHALHCEGVKAIGSMFKI